MLGRFITVLLLALVPNAAAQPITDLLAVVNRSSHDVALIHPQTFEQVARIPAGTGPQEIALSPDGRYAYVANRGLYPKPHADPLDLGVEKEWIRDTDSTITVIDLATRTVKTQFNLGRYERPHGVWVSRDGAVLWVTAEEQRALLEMEAATGALLRVWETPEAAHRVLATSDDRKLYLANTRAFSVSVIDRARGTIQTLETGRSPEGFALSPDGQELWVPNRGDDTIAVIDVATDRVVETISSQGDFSLQLTFTPDGQEVWVSNNNSNTLTVFDAHSRQHIATIPLATQPLGILAAPNGREVYVTLPRHNGVAVVDAQRKMVLRHIPTGIEPDGMAWIPAPRAEEVQFTAEDGVTLYGDLYLGPAGKQGPLVLAFHQGGGNARAEYGPLAPRLVAQGYSVLAIDQRSGGDRLGGANRTVEALGAQTFTMCEAYRDLEATVRYVKAEGFTGKRVALGSSYSASLAIRLGYAYAEDLVGVMAFSPSSGGPMADCRPDAFVPKLSVPLIVFRPAREMEIESVQQQWALFEAHDHQTFISNPGTHAASMLNPDRVDGDVEATWQVASTFLKEVFGQ